MTKPNTSEGYDKEHSAACERVLVTLLRGLGPYKKSFYLIGGLTPRYLVPEIPDGATPHAGTMDVDVVVDLQILLNAEAYHTLEENLRKMGFERAENDKKEKLTWRWQTKLEDGTTMILELLADAPDKAGGRIQPIPSEGNISALNIPHSSMVFDLHEVKEIKAELLGENGIATEKVKHADLVCFTSLKAFAFDQRGERKDAHDIIFCLQHAPGGPEAIAARFAKEIRGKHGHAIDRAIRILQSRFATEGEIEGYLKDGPVAVAKFEHGEGIDAADREARALRQRQANAVIERLLENVAARLSKT